MIFRVELLGAFRTDAVAELGFRMISDIGLELIPVSPVVPDFLARCADGKETAQLSDFGKGFFEIVDKRVTLFLMLFAFGDIPDNAAVKGILT